MDIKENLTLVNFTKGKNKKNKYIVIHYTAGDGDTAYNNSKYFKNEYRGSSAHYFVDNEEIVRSVKDSDIAWHCGSNSYKHLECRNNNSIGIEMCSRKDDNGKYYVDDKTIENTIYLIRYLMKQYSISIDFVIRHYDVTGKICPKPFIDEEKWSNFKNMINNSKDKKIDEALEKINSKVNINTEYWNEKTKNVEYLDELFVKISEVI